MKQQRIVWMDSGDTIIDEATQQLDERGIVTSAQFIPGADEMLRILHKRGYTVVLVADGEIESFQNVYKDNGHAHCFDAWVISEVVGVQKPDQRMFQTALEAGGWTENDKERIVMVGNNLKKDIAGANRFGITSVWLDWSPRYEHTYEEEDWIPTHRITEPMQLISLLEQMEQSEGTWEEANGRTL